MWINIITNKQQNRLTPGGSTMSSPSKISGSSWSKYLYNNNNHGHTSDQSCYSQSSYAESDYSLPHSPSSTRPSSQVSALSHKQIARTKRHQLLHNSFIKIFKCFVVNVTIMILSLSSIKRRYSPSITATASVKYCIYLLSKYVCVTMVLSVELLHQLLSNHPTVIKETLPVSICDVALQEQYFNLLIKTLAILLTVNLSTNQ